MDDRDLRKRLRDEATGQLLTILEPYQVAALNMDDVGHDNGKLFLRVFTRNQCDKKHKFVSLPLQVQEVLRVFLVDGRPLYEEWTEALFPNRFGERLSVRSMWTQHGRTSQKLVEREVMVVGKPCGDGFIKQFNQWNRARVIYFSQRNDGMIKIGYSKCFSTRFQTLESEHGQLTLLGLVDGDKHLEGKVKKRFRHLCVEGTEWFRPDPELLVFIQRVVKEGRDGFQFYHGLPL